MRKASGLRRVAAAPSLTDALLTDALLSDAFQAASNNPSASQLRVASRREHQNSPTERYFDENVLDIRLSSSFGTRSVSRAMPQFLGCEKGNPQLNCGE